MKVYRVYNDVSRYQYFLTQKQDEVTKLMLDCTPIEATWQPPPVFIYKPKHIPGDFYQFNTDILITNPKATEILYTFLDMAGELLPLPYNGTIYTLLNVTLCIDCLDQEKTDWLVDEETGVRALPTKYVFHRDRFDSSRIFKIPETCRGELLVVDKGQDIHEELRSAIEDAGLRGLIFEELWNDQE